MTLNNSELHIIVTSYMRGEFVNFRLSKDELLRPAEKEGNLKSWRVTKDISAQGLGNLRVELELTSHDGDEPEDPRSPILREIDTHIAVEQAAIFASESDQGGLAEAAISNITQHYINLGNLLNRRHKQTKDMNDLRQAIFSMQTALETLEDSDIDPASVGFLPKTLSKLGSMVEQVHQTTQNASDLDDVVETYQKAVELTPESDPLLPARLNDLSSALQRRFDITRDTDDIEGAITNLRKAIGCTPDGNGNLPILLSNLGSALRRQHTCTKEVHLLDEAIIAQQRSIVLGSTQHDEHRYWFSNLGRYYQLRFELNGAPQDLQQSIVFKRKAVDSIARPTDDQASKDLSEALQALAYAFWQSFQQRNNLEDLQESIAAQQRSIKTSPTDSPHLALRRRNLVVYIKRRYHLTKSKAHLQEAITAQQDEVSNLADDDPTLPDRLNELGTWLMHLGDLEQAVSSQRRALKISPKNPEILSALAQALRLQFNHTGGGMEIIDEAIAIQREAIALTETEGPDMGSRIRLLTQCLNSKLSTGAAHLKETAAEAVSTARRSLQLTIASNIPERAIAFDDLGKSLQYRFEGTGERQDLDEAIQAHSQAVDLSSGDTGVDLLIFEMNSSIALQRLFKVTGELNVVDKAVVMGRKAVAAADTIGEEARISQSLGALANALQARYERSGELSDINEAIEVHKRCIKQTPPTNRNLPSCLSNLSGALQTRAERTGRLEDIDEALECIEQAIDLTPELNYANRSTYYLARGTALQARFRNLGELEDIVSSVADLQSSVELLLKASANTPSNKHPTGLSVRLNNLGISLRLHFQHTGNLPDIQESISAHQKSVELTPEEHAEYSGRVSNLGSAFVCRYERTHDLYDIQEAVTWHERAVEKTIPGHPQLPHRLQNLATSLRLLGERLGDISDLDRAVQKGKQAIELTPIDHPLLPTILSNHGNALQRRFRLSKDPQDIEAAISTRRRALSILEDNESAAPRLIPCLNNLGSSLIQSFKMDEEANTHHLEEAISFMKIALSLTPKEDTEIWRMHEKPLFTCTRSLVPPVGIPGTRLRAAQTLARLSKAFSKDVCMNAYKTCIELMTVVGGMEQTIQSRHKMLASISDISLEAAAAAIGFSLPRKAMEWLELGRCLVWNQLNSLRTPIDALKVAHPELAERLVRVSSELEKMGSRTIEIDNPAELDGQIHMQNDALAQTYLAEEWMEILADVRGTDGFEDFLKPPPVSQTFDRIPMSGIVVVINVHQSRCDALVVKGGSAEPQHIALPNLSYQMIEEWRAKLHGGLVSAGVRSRGDNGGIANGDAAEELKSDGTRAARPRQKRRPIETTQSILEQVLKDLWVSIVSPIVQTLSLKPSKDGKAPQRIWWCPTGPLSFLPLHAAGIYGGSEGASILDYAASSYIPTVSVLAERAIDAVGEQSTSGVLLLSKHNFPGLSVIPGAKAEARAIEQHLQSKKIRALRLGEDDRPAMVEAAIAGMEQYSCVHFACHATQNTTHPLKSGFYLHDGRLELSRIIRANLRGTHVQVAFLSACQTSAGDEKLSEEAVHLAAGMLAAGYRGVVGTMWSIQDKYASEIAESFYQDLLERSGGAEIHGEHAGYSLHHAIVGIRRKLLDVEDSLLAWVPYVHFGV
ncbi:CHAT domain-containing protein [Ephemerocybe angulata]|uniref:CHAT domain-containing protein n=1 Tax=Ephemerocybe angulata TaxID=980116 RepID=A0A8H6HSM6_9AGAR|nr:CHAT domain-containing protein [Tulosesus angulatus]